MYNDEMITFDITKYYSMFGAFFYNIQQIELFGVDIFLLSWFGEFELETVPVKCDERKTHEVVPHKCSILPQGQLLFFELLEDFFELNFIE